MCSSNKKYRNVLFEYDLGTGEFYRRRDPARFDFYDFAVIQVSTDRLYAFS